MNKEFSYIKLANSLHEGIEKGIYPVLSKLPSVRTLSKNNKLSVSTVLQAFYELENRGLISAVEKSGYFVNQLSNKNMELSESEIYNSKITKINKLNLINSIFHNLSDKSLFPLSSSILPASLIPTKELTSIIKNICNYNAFEINQYYMPPGLEELRNEISKMYLNHNVIVEPEEIIITNGCMEAINFALRSIAKAGDIIAIESPTYYGFLELIESLGMYALEIPTDPITGINLDAFKQSVRDFKITGCISVPNFSNPLGALMPEENKKEFVEICQRNDIKIIESDIYADLYFDEYKPKPLKFYDISGDVITCSSLSKTVSAGLRIGWIINKKYFNDIEKLKFSTSIATATLNQMIAANFLKSKSYERYLKNIRKNLKIKVSQLTNIVLQNFSFSDEIKLSSPKGGFILWLKLPEKIDSFDIYKIALEKNISLIPGTVFSPSESYKNYIRLSASFDNRDEIEKKIIILADIIKNYSANS